MLKCSKPPLPDRQWPGLGSAIEDVASDTLCDRARFRDVVLADAQFPQRLGQVTDETVHMLVAQVGQTSVRRPEIRAGVAVRAAPIPGGAEPARRPSARWET